MKLSNHYNELWEHSLQKFRKRDFDFDPLINSKDDTRYGITLRARPAKEVRKNISESLQEIKAVAPNQYYYPNSDLHITVLAISSCYAGFSLDEINLPDYQQMV